MAKLEYGDYGLGDVTGVMREAIKGNKKIALYADYDVDGTMSCVAWIWFFKAIGFKNFTHYIPCRFKEGYGVNLDAIKYLIDDFGAELIITMDTGITANIEAAYCKQHGVKFICTDHHKIQLEKMPDCLVLNPKMHPMPEYQELCGCGITFVLLRKLAEFFSIPDSTWQDILAVTAMATICDMVPFNPVNHKLARLGIGAMLRSQRPVFRTLLNLGQNAGKIDEWDVGFRLGPRINAVGRLEHADSVIKAFIDEDPDDLVHYMTECNERRKKIQDEITIAAFAEAQNFKDDPILFLGGDWHPGVVGIVASRLAEEFWRPVWLFNRGVKMAKGSARSIKGFDVTDAMAACQDLFLKFGGHKAAGGYSFDPSNESRIREQLIAYAKNQQQQEPDLWRTKIEYDLALDGELVDLELAEALADMKPFGFGYEAPRFKVTGLVDKIVHYNDKLTLKPKHTAFFLRLENRVQKIMFFNRVIPQDIQGRSAEVILSIDKGYFKNAPQLSLMGMDFCLVSY